MNSELFRQAVAHHQSGRLQEAGELYRRVIDQHPSSAEAHHYLGVVSHQNGRLEEALELIQKALALKPDDATAHNNLGNVLRDLGRPAEAAAAYQRAVELRPSFAGAYSNLGNLEQGQGRLDEAIAHYQKAIELKPDYAEAHSNLGNALRELGRLDESVAACLQATALHPQFAEAFNNLGNALNDRKDLDGAVSAYQQATLLNPNLPEAHNNLGNVLKDVGRLNEALGEFQQAIALRPDYADAHSNLLYTLHYHPGMNARAIADVHARWNLQHVEPLRAAARPHENDRSPERRLRIGYVSPDFRHHCLSFFMLQFFAGHAWRGEFDVTCYSDVLRPDSRTAELQKNGMTWRSVVGLSDSQLADLIRQDKIDILVDLTAHLARNRMLAFARRPAPVQVTFLAYPASTGSTAIDYRLTDPYLDPPGMDETVYSEKVARLVDTFWCYTAVDAEDLPVAPLPALKSGTITFGCLNNSCKLNNELFGLWARVLHRVTPSRLLLLAPSLEHRQKILKSFAEQQIDPSRIEFISFQPRQSYLQVYDRIDIGLDSFPYNGHTTSLDSFWMGVPVVTRVGDRSVGRAGWSQLSNLGLTELAAESEDEFVSIAVNLANDLPALAELRMTLRDRMNRSPLLDGAKFTANLESVYRQMWRTWCATNTRSQRV